MRSWILIERSLVCNDGRFIRQEIQLVGHINEGKDPSIRGSGWTIVCDPPCGTPCGTLLVGVSVAANSWIMNSNSLARLLTNDPATILEKSCSSWWMSLFPVGLTLHRVKFSLTSLSILVHYSQLWMWDSFTSLIPPSFFMFEQVSLAQ